MPRVMYDSTSGFDIPEYAQMVLVYVDGIYKWSQAMRDRFKYSKQVTCSAVGAVPAQVGDVEEGCIWPPAKSVDWVLRTRAAGIDPTLYVNERNDWAPTRAAFAARGVPEPHWWVANYNGVKAIPPGSVGRQYAHPSSPPGNPTGPWHTAGHWDESWIADYWPGVDDEGDDVSASDVLYNLPIIGPDGKSPGNLNVVEYWTNVYANRIPAVEAKVDALAAAVAALAANADLTPDEMKGIVADSFAASAGAIAQQVAAATIAELRQAVREEMGEDNAAQADAIVDRVAERLAG